MSAKLLQFPLSDAFDPFDYARAPARPRRRREPKRQAPSGGRQGWTPAITDDWTDDIPITNAELDLFEAQFGGFLDDLFGLEK